MSDKLPIGTPIRFLKTLDAPANEDHPDIVYAYKDETGTITGHEAREGYMVKADRWPASFGAELGTEFEFFPCTQCGKPRSFHGIHSTTHTLCDECSAIHSE